MREIKSIFDLWIVRIAIIFNACVLLARIWGNSSELFWPIWFNIGLAFIGAVLLVVSSAIVIKRRHSLGHKWMFPLGQLPAILVLNLTILYVIIVLPMRMIAPGAIPQGNIVQSISSPDSSYTLTVRYSEHNIFIHGRGDYVIMKSKKRLQYLGLEKISCIYTVPVSNKLPNDTPFIRWVAPDTIVIDENDDTLKVD
jgi:hypothetical protein